MNLLEFAAQEAARQGVDPSLVGRVLQAESGGNAGAVSPKGARGPMQLMPGTARTLGVNIDDPLDNIRGGVRYLAQQLKTFGTPDLALAAYNAGPGNVRKYGGVPPFAETQNYVGKIMGTPGSHSAAVDDSDIFGTPARGKRTAADDSDIFAAPTQPSSAMPSPPSRPVAASQPWAPVSLLDSIKDSPVGGFVRGARDVVDGGAQLLTRGLEAVAPSGSAFEHWAQGERQKVERINSGAERDYRENWRGGRPTGLDVGRITGNIAAAAPMAALVPGVGAPAMLTRVGAGVGGGTLAGALSPVDMNDTADGDFWGAKAGQMALGGITGAAAPFVANAAGKVISGVTNRVRSFGASPNATQVQQTVSGELAGRGIDFSRLSREMQDSLLADAQKALNAGGRLNFDALGRRADFEAAGIKPTLGQLTREPGQFQFEQNTRGITGAGEGLSQRFNEQNRQLIDGLNQARTGTQGLGLDSFSAGEQLVGALRGQDATRRAAVDQLYTSARNQAGIHTPLDPSRFAQSVNDALDQAMIGDALPGGVRSALNQIATGKMPFTIQKAEQVRQAINGQMGGMPSRENAALRMVNQALQDEIDRVGSASGAQAADAFKVARGAAAERFAALDKSPALKAAAEGAAPDGFIDQHVIRGTAGDLFNLRIGLQRENPQVWGEVRGQVVDWLKGRALNGATDEYGRFSQSAYNKALNQIGEGKLKVLFDPEELTSIKRLGRVAAAIQSQPVGAAVNNSGTSQAVANLAARASGIPYLRELLIKPAQNFVMQGRVNAALNPSGIPMAQPGAQAANSAAQVSRRLQLPLSVGIYPTVKGLLE